MYVDFIVLFTSLFLTDLVRIFGPKHNLFLISSSAYISVCSIVKIRLFLKGKLPSPLIKPTIQLSIPGIFNKLSTLLSLKLENNSVLTSLIVLETKLSYSSIL